MAILKIQSDIVSSTDAQQMHMFGLDAVSYRDVDDFISQIPQDDPEIEVRLHCDGGLVSEGWAIYDGLRASGKNITVIVDGKAASMATIIMMAAPKESRKAYENATIMIHNPYIDGHDVGTLTAKRLKQLADDMFSEQNRMADLYATRCGCGRDEIQAQMDMGTPMTAARALELGIIGEIIPPASAKGHDNSINIKGQAKTMKEETMQVKTSVIDRLLAKLGLKNLDEVDAIDAAECMDDGAAEAVAMELNTEDGGVLNVERESGEPQIGDKAQPDGEHKMPDGRVIVVEEGVITDIRTVDNEGGEETEETDDADIVAVLTQRIDELKTQLAEAKKNAKSISDMRILNAVAMAGGESVLKRFASTQTIDARQRDGKGAKAMADNRGEFSPIQRELDARKKGEWKKE